MKAVTELLLRFERGCQGTVTLADFLEELRGEGIELTKETCLELIAIDAERQLKTGILSNVESYTKLFPTLVAHDIEANLLETIQEFTDTFCPIRSLHGAFPADVEGYRFHREIGRGAAGVVYEAEQLSLGRTVAAKVHFLNPSHALHPSTELSLLASVEHECIPTIYDHTKIGERPCLFMKMIDGLSLRRYCDLQTLASLDRSIQWMIQLTHAIEECHQHGILHCDLKPDNVLICGDRPFVVDFGLACPLGRTKQAVYGSPGYFPPEMLSDQQQPLMTSGDVYALGVILYELLTGFSPYPDDDFSQPPRRPSDLRPNIEPELEAICYRAIALDPSERYLSAESLRLDLQAWYADYASSPVPKNRLWKWLSEHAASFLA